MTQKQFTLTYTNEINIIRNNDNKDNAELKTVTECRYLGVVFQSNLFLKFLK